MCRWRLKQVATELPAPAARFKKLCVLQNSYDESRFFQRHSRERREFRKTQQLCQQVSNAIEIELASADDPRLQDLRVLQVEPAPDSSRLAIVVSYYGEEPFDPEELLDALDVATSRLRHEVAQAITRRRAPDLTFRLVPRREEER